MNKNSMLGLVFVADRYASNFKNFYYIESLIKYLGVVKSCIKSY